MNKSLLRKLFLLLGDWTLLYLSLLILVLIRYTYDWQVNWDIHFRPFSLIFPIWILSFYGAYLYEARYFRQGIDTLRTISTAVFVAFVASIIAFYLFPPGLIHPRRNLVIFAAIYGVVVVTWRALFYRTLRRRIQTNVLFLGNSEEVKELQKFFKENPDLKYDVKGVFQEAPKSFKEVADKISRSAVRLVVVQPSQRSSSIRNLFPLLSSPVTVVDLETFYEQIFNKVSPGIVNDAWFIQNLENISSGVYEASKRLIDIIIGTLGTAVYVFSYLPLGAAIKLESKGSILFKQRRVGRGGKVFNMYKFRSMYSLTPGGSAETEGPKWASDDDRRVTKIGRFMRKTRLDELPQFWNILKGDMSFVGPRPERPEFVESLTEKIPYYNMRHLVKPGLTGWAQINYKYGSSVKDARIKLQYDIYYAKKRSLVLDLAIVLKTIKITVTGQGQ